MLLAKKLPNCARPDLCSTQLRVRAKLRTVRTIAFRSAATDRTKRCKLDRDEAKECSRKFRRTTFDHDQWAQHRSTGRYWRHLKSGLASSRIVRGLAAPLIYVGAISFAVVSYETALKDGVLPDLTGASPWWHWPSIAMSISGPFSLSTFALSLLLVFRTNSSYQRWNEARKLWGSMINRSRDIARQTLQWFPQHTNAGLAAAMCRWTTAFPFVLMVSLREDHTLYESLHDILTADELSYLMKQQHPGSAVLQMMGACVRASNATEIQKARIDENITFMQDIMGGCERIFRTPIPLSYTRHTSRFLMCWLSLLPFCVADSYGYMTVPLAIGMAFFLFGIEEIGVQIEEPFGILALEVFCETILKNIKQAQRESVDMQSRAEAYLAPGTTAAAAAAAAGDSLSQELSQLLAAAAGGRMAPNGSSSSSNSSLALDPSVVSGTVGGHPLLERGEGGEGLNTSSSSSSNSLLALDPSGVSGIGFIGGHRLLEQGEVLNASSSSSSNNLLALDPSAISGIVAGHPLLEGGERLNTSSNVLVSERILGASDGRVSPNNSSSCSSSNSALALDPSVVTGIGIIGGYPLLDHGEGLNTGGSSSSNSLPALDPSVVSGIVAGHPLLEQGEVLNTSNNVLLSGSFLGTAAAAPPQQHHNHGPSRGGANEEVYAGSQVSVSATIDDGFTF